MKDCGGHFHGKHLKRSLDYVMNPEKTQDGRLIGAINCQVDSAFEQMKATKRKFGKVDKRQGQRYGFGIQIKTIRIDRVFSGWLFFTQLKNNRPLFCFGQENVFYFQFGYMVIYNKNIETMRRLIDEI